ncbi:MAG: serpin family protein [FCB group bacterium]|nr:serpin family protein [FCB group bacterium]
MKKTILALIIGTMLFYTACSGTKVTQEVYPPFSEEEIVSGINQFAFDMLTVVSREHLQNIFYSPLSISSALAMTYAGAREQTAREMQKALHFGPQHPAFHEKYGTLSGSLQSAAESAFTMHIANAIWVQNDYRLRKDYLKIVQEYYQSISRELDFVGAPDVSTNIINQWVSDATNDRIRDLIPAGVIDAFTRLILTNAVYFNAEWEQSFNPAMTQKDDFYPLIGEAYKTDMMYKRHHFHYSQADNYQILEIDYKGKAQQMLLVLPKDRYGLEELITHAGRSMFERHDEKKREEDVILYFPKFRLETDYELNTYLHILGMKQAFTPYADFSGMTGSRDLMISNVIHKAFIEVDEFKTEAAAATAVVMRLTAMPPAPRAPIEFRADHPFLFMIRDINSGTILFIGCVTAPEVL